MDASPLRTSARADDCGDAGPCVVRGARAAFLCAVPYFVVAGGLLLLRSGWAALLFYHAAMALVLTVFSRRPARSWNLRAGWSGRTGVPMLLLCGGTGGVFWLLWPTVARDPAHLAARLDAFGLSGPALVLFAAWYSTVHPLLEESYWRGLLGSAQRGPVLSDAAFAGYHALVLPFFVRWPWVVVSFLALTTIAWAWRRLAGRHGGLAIPVLAHAVADLSTMAAVFVLRS